ncbi:hypothetical protein ScPMuIL_003275 [Solemya velum]
MSYTFSLITHTDELSLQSFRGRYGEDESPSPDCSDSIQSQREFEKFVRDFPIDDSISECFADSDTETATCTQDEKAVLPGYRPPPHSGQNTLKKSIEQAHSSDHKHNNDGSSSSSESKKSKIGSLFNRKKSKGGSKEVKSPLVAGITDVIIDACLHITDSYQGKPSNKNDDDATQSDGSDKGGNDYSTGRVYYMDLEHTMDESEMLLGTNDGTKKQNVSNGNKFVHNTQSPEKFEQQSDRNKFSRTTQPTKQFAGEKHLPGNGDLRVHLSPTGTMNLKPLERQGDNNALHKRVIEGNIEAVRKLVDSDARTGDHKFNYLAACDLSIKSGQPACLQVLLQGATSVGVLTRQHLSRLLGIATSCAQIDCLGVLVDHIPRDELDDMPLPVDEDGNTACHMAAIRGIDDAVHTLLTRGCCMSKKNRAGQRPIHMAHQNRRHNSFRYLLLFDVCQSLLRELVFYIEEEESLRQRQLETQVSLQQLSQSWRRHQLHLAEAIQGIADTKAGLLDSLKSLQQKLVNFANGDKEISSDMSTVIDELNAEAERVNDLLEFSPLAEMTGILNKVSAVINDVVLNNENEETTSSHKDNSRRCDAIMRDILQDVFKSEKPQIDTDDIVKKRTRTPFGADQTENGDAKTSEGSLKGKPHTGNTLVNSSVGSDEDIRSDSSVSTITNSQSVLESCYSSTTTSAVTSNKQHIDQPRDWADYFGKSATPRPTSETTNSVCDSFENIDWNRKDLEIYEADDDDEVYNYVKLNLENENLTDEDLRKQRLSQHLNSLARISSPSNDLVETVTTSSGEKIVYSSKKKAKRKVAEEIKQSEEKGKTFYGKEKSHGPLRWFKGRDKKSHVKLFTVEELVTTQEFTDPNFLHSYQSSRDQVSSVPWEDAVLTDFEETEPTGRPWYELSDEEDSIIQTWRGEEDDGGSRRGPV